jgi:hypothetical protein
MNKMDKLLNNMQQEAGGLYEMESYEMENYVMRNPNRFPSMSNAIAAKRANGQIAHPHQAHLVINKGDLGTTPISAAQFNIIVTRVTSAVLSGGLPTPLPFALFGVNDSNNGYRQSLAGFIPVGVTLTSVLYGTHDNLPNSCEFTYTDGANIDIVRVTCQEFPYPSFLLATQNDLFKLTKVRYSLSDVAQLAQFNNPLQLTERTMFGKVQTNNVSVGAYKSPDQFQNGIIDINGEFSIDSETSIVSQINNAGAGFSITISAFVQKFLKYNANNF